MTQDTVPLDERGLEAALKVFEADHGENSEAYLSAAIRAYLQTAAADVSGLARSIDRWRKMVPVAVTAGSPAQIEYALADAKHDIITLWATLQTLSASNAALEAENERLRGEMSRIVELDDKAYSLGAAARALGDVGRIARAALSAPKGGQDHG